MSQKNKFLQVLGIISLIAPCSFAAHKELCGEPGRSGTVDYRDTDDPYTIEIICKPGYRVVGNEIRRCQANGRWEPPIPWCQPNLFYLPDNSIQAGDLDEDIQWENFKNRIENVAEIGPEPLKILFREYITTRTISFSAKTMPNRTFPDVFVTIGNQTKDPGLNCTVRKHQVRGSGLVDLEFACPVLPTDVVSVSTLGSKVRLKNVGLFSDLPGDDEICGTPDSPANGRATQGNGTFRYECNQGYRLVGNDTTACRGGEWSGEVPICVSLSAYIDSGTVSQPNTTTSTGFLEVYGLTVVILTAVLVIVVIFSVIAYYYYKIDRPHFERVNNFEA